MLPSATATRGLLALLAVVVALPACAPGLSAGEAARVVAAEALEYSAGATWKPLAAGQAVPDGARLRTGGDARLDFRGTRVLVAAGAVLVAARDGLELVRGGALVDSRGGFTARWADVTVSGAGVWRLYPGVSPRVGVYRGQADVRRFAESRQIPALRQLGLSSRRLASGFAPLAYRADDAWDRDLLAPAIAFDDESGRLARGIDRAYGTTPQPAAFYRSFVSVSESVLPVLSRTARISSGEAFGPPSDALLTLFVARAAAGAGSAIDRTAQRIRDLRVAGARWGLVAVELEVAAEDLTRIVDLAQVQRELAAAELGLASASEESAVAPQVASAAPAGEPAAPADGTAGRSGSGPSSGRSGSGSGDPGTSPGGGGGGDPVSPPDTPRPPRVPTGPSVTDAVESVVEDVVPSVTKQAATLATSLTDS